MLELVEDGGKGRVIVWSACLAAVAIFVARVVVPSAQRPATVGFTTCYAESRILLEDPGDLRRIYDDGWFQPRIDGILGKHVAEIAHGQVPTMAFILAPLAWLSPAGARGAWIVFSALAWAAAAAVLATALGLRRFRGVPGPVWLLAVGTAFRPITENLRLGQGYALLCFLLCLVVYVVLRTDRRRWAWAGVPLGLMLMLKSAGLWLYPLLAAARRWRILLAAGATCLVVALAATALAGWEVWRAYARDAVGWLASEPSAHVTAYQTLRSLTGHLFEYQAVYNPRPIADLPRFGSVLTFVIIAGLFAESARVQRICSDSLEERALTLAMFIALIVPVAPIGEGYHYVLLFPAVVIAWWWFARARPGREIGIVLVMCTALLCVPGRFYWSDRLRDGWAALLAYPRVYGALGLWAALASALRRRVVVELAPQPAT